MRKRLRSAISNEQDDVADFHEAMEMPASPEPAIQRGELRCSLIEEEARETCAAIRAGDLIGAIDGLCDLLYVAYGTAVEFGIALGPFWDEVHRTNMAKVGGPVREDGKRLKPPGWTPPDLRPILAKQRWLARARRHYREHGCDLWLCPDRPMMEAE